MTSVSLKSDTQAAINAAVDAGGTDVALNVAAYNDIARDTQGTALNQGTINWFAGAGGVNGQQVTATGQGTFIYAYTRAAIVSEAAAAGKTVAPPTNLQMQTSSNKIALTTLRNLQDHHYVVSDASGDTNFSPQAIAKNEAGSGVSYLESLYPGIPLDNAIWGGTLFARTSLNNPTYITDYNLNLTPGSNDCNAILAGNQAGVGAVFHNLSVWSSGISGWRQEDSSILTACSPLLTTPIGPIRYQYFAPYSPAPSLYFNLNTAYGDGTQQSNQEDPAQGVTASETISFGSAAVGIAGMEGGSTSYSVSLNGATLTTGAVANANGVDPSIILDTTGASVSAGGASSSILVGTNGATLDGGTGQSVIVGLGNNEVVNSYTGGTILTGTGDSGNVYGNAVTVGANVQANLVGGGNTSHLSTGDSLGFSGGSNIFTNAGTNDLLFVSGTAGQADTVSGYGVTGTTASGQTAGVGLGANTQVNATVGSSAFTLATGDSLSATGGKDIFDNVGTNDLLYIAGTGGQADTVSGYGVTGTTATGQTAGIGLGVNAQVNATVGSSAFTLTTGDSLSATGGKSTFANVGASDLLYIAGTGGQADTVSGYGVTGTTAAGQTAGIGLGVNAQVNATVGSSAFTLATGDSLSATGGGSTFGNVGANDLLYISGTAGQADTVYGYGVTGITAAGQTAGIGLAANVQVNATAGASAFTLTTGDNLGATGGGSTFGNVGANDLLYIAGTGGQADTVYGYGVTGTTAAGQAAGISIGANAQVNATVSSSNISVGSNSTLGLSGGSDGITTAGNATMTIAGTTAQIDSDFYNSVAGDRVTYNNSTTGTSQVQTSDPNSSTALQINFYTGSNGTGSLQASESGFTNGTSQVTQNNPEAGVTTATANYSASGTETSLKFQTSGGNVFTDTFQYNGTTLADYYQQVANSAGQQISLDEFNSGGQLVDEESGYTPPDTPFSVSATVYGLATGLSKKAAGIDVVAQYDKAHGQLAAAQLADAGRQAALALVDDSPSSGAAAASPFEGATWAANQPITWSFADAGGTVSPVSGAIPTQYQSVINQALQSWGSASGLTFEQVADTAAPDIRIGWGALDTADSGVAGVTSFQSALGALAPGATIRLEDPSEDALIAGNGGTLTYSGTDVQLYQLVLHEIGHALGLADNSDPHSVLFPELGSSNLKLDATDFANIRTLYAPTSSASAVASMGVSSLLTGGARFVSLFPGLDAH